MSRLETIVSHVLSPILQGKSDEIPEGTHAVLASWIQKTALVSMRTPSAEDLAAGHGLPVSEYRALFKAANASHVLPPANVWCWVGRYAGEHRKAAVWVVPAFVSVDPFPEPETPHGYVTSIVLESLLFQSMRFTVPQIATPLVAKRGLSALWPVAGPISCPPSLAIDDNAFQAIAQGRNLSSLIQGLGLHPWTKATDLPPSVAVGDTVQLPTPCGKGHFAFYPGELVRWAQLGHFCCFVVQCECDIAYFVVTRRTKASFVHCGAVEQIRVIYERQTGAEHRLDYCDRSFRYRKWVEERK